MKSGEASMSAWPRYAQAMLQAMLALLRRYEKGGRT